MKKLIIVLVCCLALVLYIYVDAPIHSTADVPNIESKTISLNFVGDILAARTIETAMRKNGYDYPFLKIVDELKDADITFANLETPLIAGNTTPGGNTVFRADTAFADALKRSGIDIVSLANNHMKDQGEKGIVSTLEALDKAEVQHAGAGLDLEKARALKIIETNGVKVGYLAYNDTDVVPPNTYANDMPQSGTNTMDTRRLEEDVLAARSLVDVLIVSMHSGTEYVTEKPNTRQTMFARAAIDYGADMVIGHHPHVLQPMEIYKNKYIFYSLGNFVFDQIIAPTKESALLKMWITFSKTDTGGWKIKTQKPEILPLIIQNFQPQKTTDAAKKKLIMSRFATNPNILLLGNRNIFVESATTPESRELGLSRRKKLPQETGLLFVFDGQNHHGIWMKDMLFPIDIFWFDDSFKLVDKRLSVDPSTFPDVFYPKLKATYVLETQVGLLDPVSLTQDLTGELTLLQSYDKR